MPAPRFSIITPTYNRFEYLRVAIGSVQAQTETDFEMLILDDGNSAVVRDYCLSLADPRIRYLPNDSPLGIARNNFKGFRAAQGEFATTLHDDDRWCPDFLDVCREQFESATEVDVVFADHWIIDGSGERLLRETEDASRFFGRTGLAGGLVAEPLHLLVQNALPFVASTVFRRSLVPWSTLDESVGGAYDYYLGALVLRNARKVVYLPSRHTEYRVHDGSASATRRIANARERIRVRDLLIADSAFAPIAHDLKVQRRAYANQLIKAHVRRGELGRASAALIRRLQCAF